jgi:acyl-CoA thioesterase YciA
MREVEFIAPVYVGDVVSFYTSIQHQGTTSLTVRVEVEAERFDNPRHTVRVTAAEVVYVAVDKAGKPLSIG